MLLPALANHATLAAAAPARLRFARALRNPAAAQRAILERIVRANAATLFGVEHGFASVRTPADFARQVPLRDYDGMQPWLARVERGERAVLTGEGVRFVEPTGGSSGPSKLVPYTASLLGDFSAATLPWMFDLMASRAALRTGRAYWSVTPPGPRPARTEGGLPVGMEGDADYFPAPLRALLDTTFALPRCVARAPDVDSCRYLTLRALLAATDLAFVSVWSPSFLSLLAAQLDAHFDMLLRDMESGTISIPLDPALRAAVQRALPARPALATLLRRSFGRTPPRDLGLLWDRLALISCWADGHAARSLEGVRARFPRVEIQGKGLLATEGVVSIPIVGVPVPVAAVTSHYLEFIPEGSDEAIPLEAVERDASYEVVLTTSGGLHRYRLRDIVRVEGWLHATPLLSFRGRADHASDLAGEKLTPALVERAIEGALRMLGVRTPFAMLAPSFEPSPHYRLYVDCDGPLAACVAAALDAELSHAHHYALCRSLGQLGPVRGVAVRGAERLYERACAARGQRAGAIKPPALEASLGWERHFELQQVA